jgi:hypothetical protein
MLCVLSLPEPIQKLAISFKKQQPIQNGKSQSATRSFSQA